VQDATGPENGVVVELVVLELVVELEPEDEELLGLEDELDEEDEEDEVDEENDVDECELEVVPVVTGIST